MDERQKQILELLPLHPDDAFDEWARHGRQMKKNVIVFNMAYVPDLAGGPKQKMVRCACSACEQIFYQAVSSEQSVRKKTVDFGWYDDNMTPIGNESACLCPCCGAEATSIHSSKIPRDGRTIGVSFPMQVKKLGGVPVLICWRYRKIIEKNSAAWIDVDRYEAYSFHGKKAFRYTGYYPGFMGSAIPVDGWEPRAACWDGIREQNNREIYPFRRDVFKGTALENAKFKEYMEASEHSCYPVTYLRTFQKHPQVENLVVQGAGELLNRIILANRYYSGYGYYVNEHIKVPEQGINWKSKRPAEMLDLNKTEFAYFKTHKWNLDALEAYKKIRAAGYHVDIFEYAEKKKPVTMDQAVTFASEGWDPERVCRYLEKQNRKHQPPEDCDGVMLRDYWNMAARAGVRLQTVRDRFPPDLYGSHEQMVELQNRRLEEERRRWAEQRAQEQKKEAEKRFSEFQQLAELWAPLAFSAKGLCIRIAADPKELIEEGLRLNHCVGGYIGIHAQGKRCIFFVRKEKKPDEPYFTLELDMEKMTTIQNRGKKNCERTPEVIAFEKAWLTYIQQYKGLDKKQKARKSA